MKVLLVGATFNSNFGDMLFTHLFYKKCKEVGAEEVLVWQLPNGNALCRTVREELGLPKVRFRKALWRALSCDALIIYSGGMFGEPCRTRVGTIKRFFRFILPGLVFVMLGISVFAWRGWRTAFYLAYAPHGNLYLESCKACFGEKRRNKGVLPKPWCEKRDRSYFRYSSGDNTRFSA